MGPPINIGTLYAGQQVMIERVDNLKEDLDEKHNQNRKDIHQMQNDIQSLSNQVWLVKLKIAAYAAGGGVTTGIILKLIEHFWK